MGCVCTAYEYNPWNIPDSKVHVAHLGPTWVLSALGRPHVGPMNHAIRDAMSHRADTACRTDRWSETNTPTRTLLCRGYKYQSKSFQWYSCSSLLRSGRLKINEVDLMCYPKHIIHPAQTGNWNNTCLIVTRLDTPLMENTFWTIC